MLRFMRDKAPGTAFLPNSETGKKEGELFSNSETGINPPVKRV